MIEHWNGANDFVFFARRGELASNRTEDHELSMLSLHLLQNCMVYINTLVEGRITVYEHCSHTIYDSATVPRTKVSAKLSSEFRLAAPGFGCKLQ